MLPDLRIVIAAVISTFVLTVGVGFFASSRLINEPRKSTDSIAALDATPVNRIALSWPAPTRQPEPLALDFAVTAKALRNPVRDVTGELPAAGQPSQPAPSPAQTTATDLARPPAETPPAAAPAVIATPKPAAPETASPQAAGPEASSPQAALPEAVPQRVADAPAAPEAALPVAAPAPDEPAAVLTEAPTPAPEPDIRIAVQYPPILELPPELRAPIAPATPAVAAIAPPSDAPATTGSIAVQAGSVKIDDEADVEPGKEPETKLASRPEPDDATEPGWQSTEIVPVPKPAPGLKRARAAPKKAAPKRVVRRPVRRAAPPAQPAVPNFFNMFTLQQPPR